MILETTTRYVDEKASQVTKVIVGDYKQPTAQEPQTSLRYWLRIVVVLCTASFLLAVLIVFASGDPPLHTTRVYSPDAVHHLMEQEHTFGNTSSTWTCPCESQLSFSDFMFFNLTQFPSDMRSIFPILNDSDSVGYVCQNLSDACLRYSNSSLSWSAIYTYHEVACESMMLSTLQPDGTFITFNYVTQPETVWKAVAHQAMAAIKPVREYNQLLGQMPDAWYCIENLYDILTALWGIVADSSDTMPDAAAFWDLGFKGSASGFNFSLVWSIQPYNQTVGNGSYMFPAGSIPSPSLQSEFVAPEALQRVMPVISFSWSKYIQSCGVSYCDVSKHTSVVYRVFIAFSQVGGILNVVAIVIKVLIWPALTRIFFNGHKTRQVEAVQTNRSQSNGSVQLVSGPRSDVEDFTVEPYR